MADDTLDGELGRTGHEPPPFLHGSLADLTARANAAGFPTVSTWVDHLEREDVTAYELLGRAALVVKALVAALPVESVPLRSEPYHRPDRAS